MRFKLHTLDSANADMIGIKDYLSQFYTNTAKNFFVLMQKKVGQLKKTPYIYQPSEIDPFFRRMWLVITTFSIRWTSIKNL